MNKNKAMTDRHQIAIDKVVIFLDSQMDFELKYEVHHPLTDLEVFIPVGLDYSVRNIGNMIAHLLYGYER